MPEQLLTRVDRGTGENSGSEISQEERGLSFPSKPFYKQQSQLSQGQRVDMLFVFDSRPNRPHGCTSFQQAYYQNAVVEGISDWNALTQVLSRYSVIQTLIICTHGMPGALMIAGRLPSDAEIRAYFGNSHVQVAGQIIFEGCNVMRNPIATAQMIRDISVPGTQVSGYSLYHYSAPVNVYFPPGTDEAQCQDVLNGYMAYLASSTPPASWFASHPGRHTLLLEWFGPRTDLDLPPEYRIGDMRSRDHIPRSEMTLTTVNTRQEAESIRSRYARAPVSSLEIITITDVATACGEPW